MADLTRAASCLRRSQEEAQAAIEQINGRLIGRKRVRCQWAHRKAPTVTGVDLTDPHNTTVYVGGIAPEVSQAELRRHFQPFGIILGLIIHRKGGFGFVSFQVQPACLLSKLPIA